MKIQIKGRLVEVDMVNGKPVIKAKSEQIRHPDGRVDVVVHVPCIELQGGANGKRDL